LKQRFESFSGWKDLQCRNSACRGRLPCAVNKRPSVGPWRLARKSLAGSPPGRGGTYFMVMKFSTMLIRFFSILSSPNGTPKPNAIGWRYPLNTNRRMMLYCRSSYPPACRWRQNGTILLLAGIAEFLLHESEHSSDLLRRCEMPPAGLKANRPIPVLARYSRMARGVITSSRAACVDRFLPGGRLDEVRSGHHRKETGRARSRRASSRRVPRLTSDARVPQAF